MEEVEPEGFLAIQDTMPKVDEERQKGSRVDLAVTAEPLAQAAMADPVGVVVRQQYLSHQKIWTSSCFISHTTYPPD